MPVRYVGVHGLGFGGQRLRQEDPKYLLHEAGFLGAIRKNLHRLRV